MFKKQDRVRSTKPKNDKFQPIHKVSVDLYQIFANASHDMLLPFLASQLLHVVRSMMNEPPLSLSHDVCRCRYPCAMNADNGMDVMFVSECAKVQSTIVL